MIMEEQGYILVYTISDERIAFEGAIYYTVCTNAEISVIIEAIVLKIGMQVQGYRTHII